MLMETAIRVVSRNSSTSISDEHMMNRMMNTMVVPMRIMGMMSAGMFLSMVTSTTARSP